ncbi:hypothetical protein TL16_g01889 [Triparma laevis f. inornata]|uniref:Uncharacterized protein n=1 Tax=Triparma laevis f. inornata TaxID=1714386 RepID=A0A9W7DV51_9STRA|nr:hypothetical protein TL16_g01889 [Triparma laevis f. inornata]
MSVQPSSSEQYTTWCTLITQKAKDMGMKCCVVIYDESLNVLASDSCGLAARSLCKAKAKALKSKKSLSAVGSIGYMLARLRSMLGLGLSIQGAVKLTGVGYVSCVSNSDTSKTVEVLDQGLRECKIFQVSAFV